MRLIFIAYFVLINFIGFLIMGIDKRRARKNRWRIREKTLFIIALLFGSIGILVGMYVFRHKTRHMSFVLGIPAILILQLTLCVFLYNWTHRQMESPSQAVKNELDLIEQLDPATIQSFVSYENLMHSHLSAGSIDDETADAVSLFFKNFKYSIQEEQIQENTATVSVRISNLDMHALAHDLCRTILQKSISLTELSTLTSTDEYYQLLHDTLKNGDYPVKETPATFHLQKDETGWIILADRTLENEIVSGFVFYMNDPYLLSASEVLSLYLDSFQNLSASQWQTYLNLTDVFATYNAEYYEQIDAEYFKQLAADYHYEILRCAETEDTAVAVVRITSIGMPSVLSAYKEKLLAYAATPKSIRDDETQISNETAALLLSALQENQASKAADINITLHNNGTTWEAQFDDSFTDAIMGSMSEAMEMFRGAE